MVKSSLGNHIVIRKDVVMGGFSNAIGKVDLSAGYDWSAGTGTVQTFTIALNGYTAQTITLDADCANIGAVIIEVQAAIDAAFPSSQFTVSAYNTNYVKIVSNEGYYVLGEVTALATLGILPGTYVGVLTDDYDAKATGQTSMAAGHDWSVGTGAVGAFTISLNGAAALTVDLDADCGNIGEVITEVQAGIDAVFTGSEFTVSAFDTNYVRITSNTANDYFTLTDGVETPLADMGIAATTFYGNELISAPKGDVSMPFESILREKVKTLNQAKSTHTMVNKGHLYKDGSLPLYLQNDQFLIMALAGTRGELIPSLTAHWQNAIDDLESYGCQIPQYEITFGADEWDEQNIELFNRETETTDVNTFTTDIGFLPLSGNTIPLAWYDHTITVDGNDVDILSGALRVINESDKDNTTFVIRKYRGPARLGEQIIEFDLTFQSESEALRQLVDAKAETLDHMNIVIVFKWGSGNKTLTLINFYVDPESVNLNELKDGFYEFSATWFMGTTSSYTYA